MMIDDPIFFLHFLEYSQEIAAGTPIVIEVRVMKRKNHSGASKRFKRTGTGKIIRKRAGKRHLLVHKSSKRRRSLGQSVTVHPGDVGMIQSLLPCPK